MPFDRLRARIIPLAELVEAGAYSPRALPRETAMRKIRDVGNQRGIIVYGYKFKPVMR